VHRQAKKLNSNKQKNGLEEYMDTFYRSTDTKTEIPQIKKIINQPANGSIFLNETYVNEKLMRPMNMKFVQKMKADFNMDMIGTIVVHTDDWKSYEILDGQHRVELLKQLFGSTHQISCLVLTGMTEAQRAEFYINYNMTRRSLSSIEKFKARLEAGDDNAIVIHELCKAFNILISGVDTKSRQLVFPVVTAVNQIEKIYNAGLLGRTLDVLYSAYQYATPEMAKEAFGTYIMENVSKVIATYFDTIDLDRLEDVLSKASARSWNVRINDGNLTLKSIGGALKIVDAYNARLHKQNQLTVEMLMQSRSGVNAKTSFPRG